MNYQKLLSGVLSGETSRLGKSRNPAAGKKRYPLARGEAVVTPLPDTIEGIEFQVERMAEYVREYSGHPDVVDFAREIVVGDKAQDLKAEAKTVYKFLLLHTRYVRDPVRKELIQTPERMVRIIRQKGVVQGDCDELATLTATMLSAIGHETRFVFGAFDRGWQHVWVEDLDANKGKGSMLDLAERLPFGRVLGFDKYGTFPIWQ